MSFFNIVAATNEDTVVAAYEPSKVRSDSYQSEAELEKEFIRLLCEQGYIYLPLHTEDELIANLRSQLEELNHYESVGRGFESLPSHQTMKIRTFSR